MDDSSAYKSHRGGGLRIKGKVRKERVRKDEVRKESSKKDVVSSKSGSVRLKVGGGCSSLDLAAEKEWSTFELQEGRIVSTEVTVQGFETSFMHGLKVGDCIGVQHPTSMEFEQRVVTSILSQRTLTVDSPFSSDLISTTAFYARASNLEMALPETEEEMAKLVVQNRQGTVVHIREKTGMWSYQTKTVKLDQSLSSDQLLDLRIKQQGRDKYC